MIYQISSGQGPAECELGVAKFLEYLKRNYSLTILETSKGWNAGTYRSVKFSTEEDLSQYEGSVQWICRSPYRPTHKRKNWFLDFSVCQAASTEEFDPEQVVFETFRSGGKGGQNVNKVESGVRAIYLPTGQAVECTEERSQYANKQKAIARLREITKQKNQQEQAAVKNTDWRCHTSLERGNAGAVFIGMDFRKKKARGCFPAESSVLKTKSVQRPVKVSGRFGVLFVNGTLRTAPCSFYRSRRTRPHIHQGRWTSPGPAWCWG